VGAALRVPLLGAGAVFPTAPHLALPIAGLAIAVAVGAVAGLAATGLTWMVYASEDAFLKLPIHWMWWPAIGGLVVGLGGLVAPRALGVGYPVIRDLFAGHLVGGVVLALLVAKAVMWSVALGSGTSGGVLAPLLIMGGALGAAESGFIPLGDAGMWAIISTAAVMGGTMRSPLTAIVFLLELTHDVNLVGGLLVATATSHAVTVLLMRRSILTEKVARRGHHVMRELAVNPLALFRVDDVMHPPTSSLPADTLLDAAFERRLHEDPQLNRARAWPLVDASGALAGILTRGDIERARRDAANGAPPAIEAGTTTLKVAYPEELLEEAMNAMIVNDLRQLPVVDRKSPTRLLGMMDASAIAAAWAELRDEDHVREAGELTAAVRLFRRKVARLRAGLK
jgi:CBS domain-containing protein